MHPVDSETRFTRPPRPAPLLLPAACFAVGIAAAEFAAPNGASLNTARLALGLAGAGLATVLIANLFSRRAAVRLTLLALVALSAGIVRHQTATNLPDHHVANHLDEQRVLTRVTGRVVSVPTLRPAQRRNPFVPIAPRDRLQFAFALTQANDVPAVGTIRASIITPHPDDQNPRPLPNFHIGDTLNLTGWLYQPPRAQNPGDTDWRTVWRYRGLSATLSIPDANLVKRHTAPATTTLARWRAVLAGRTQALLTDAAHLDTSAPSDRLLATMILGRRGAADEALNETFRRVGGMHFLAVSGFHVGVLAGIIWFLLRLARVPTPARGWCVIGALLVYLLVADPNTPVLRAVVMASAVCVAFGLGRPVCAVNILSAAALLLLAIQPLSLFQPGFQLSFIQVLMLMTVFPVLFRAVIDRRRADEPIQDLYTRRALWVRRAYHATAGLALVCLTAWLTAAPLVWLHFGTWAPWGPLQSLLLTPLVILVVWVGAITLLLGALPLIGTTLAAAFLPIVHAVADALLVLATQLGNLPGALLHVPRPSAALVLATYTAAALLFHLWRRTAPRPAVDRARARRDQRVRIRTARRATVATAGLLIPAWLAVLAPHTSAHTPTGMVQYAGAHSDRPAGDTLRATILSVGSGSCAIVTLPSGAAWVVDCGTITNADIGDVAARALRALDVRRLDAIALSHANFDHYSGAPRLAREYPPARWITSTYFRTALTESRAMRHLKPIAADLDATPPVSASDRIAADGVIIEVLWPPADIAHWPTNERSLVLRFHHADRSLLLPGDIEAAALSALVTRHRRGEINLLSDVLVAPHHGAVVGPTRDFLAAVAPRIIINSTGKPRPAFRDLVRSLWSDAVGFYSTADRGAITVTLSGNGEIHARGQRAHSK